MPSGMRLNCPSVQRLLNLNIFDPEQKISKSELDNLGYKAILACVAGSDLTTLFDVSAKLIGYGIGFNDIHNKVLCAEQYLNKQTKKRISDIEGTERKSGTVN
jgi:hypothetical protein